MKEELHLKPLTLIWQDQFKWQTSSRCKCKWKWFKKMVTIFLTKWWTNHTQLLTCKGIPINIWMTREVKLYPSNLQVILIQWLIQCWELLMEEMESRAIINQPVNTVKTPKVPSMVGIVLLWLEECPNHNKRAGNHFVIKEDSKHKILCWIVIAEVALLTSTLKEWWAIIKDVFHNPLVQKETNTIASLTSIHPKIHVKELDKLEWVVEVEEAKQDQKY